MYTVVQAEKSTDEDPIITAVKDTSISDDVADHIDDDVCVTQVTVEKPTFSSVFKNLNNQSAYDLGNFTNILLFTNREKRQILDRGTLQPSGPFPKDNRYFSKLYYFSTSIYGPVHRFWLWYSKILDAAYCQPSWLFASQRNNIWCKGIQDWKYLSERMKQHSFLSGHAEACVVNELGKKSDSTINKELKN